MNLKMYRKLFSNGENTAAVLRAATLRGITIALAAGSAVLALLSFFFTYLGFAVTLGRTDITFWGGVGQLVPYILGLSLAVGIIFCGAAFLGSIRGIALRVKSLGWNVEQACDASEAITTRIWPMTWFAKIGAWARRNGWDPDADEL